MRWNDWLSIAAIIFSLSAFIFRWKLFFNTLTKIHKRQSFPNMKDLTYWLLMLLIIISVISTWRTNDPGKLADQLSLGGTFLSILLAVVAIIFSFIQSSSSSQQTERLVDKISRLTHTIEGLERVSKSLEDKNENHIVEFANVFEEAKDMRSAVDNIGKSMENLLEEVKDKLKSNNNSLELDVEEINSIQNNFSEKINKLMTNDLLTSVTVAGPRSMFNLIKQLTENNGRVHIQVLWMELFDRGIRMNMTELKNTLNKLEQEYGVKIIKEDGHEYVTTLEQNKIK